MEIIRFADLKAEPWRNGGGVTRQIVSHPSPSAAPGGARDGGWDWRVSIADVTKAGDFSPFPGVERLLTVVEGELLLLTVNGAEHPVEKYRPFRFSGEATTVGALPTGDVRNLNVMTRTGAFKGYTSIIELSKKRAHPVFEGQLGVLLQGQVKVGTAGAEPADLGRYDAVVGSGTETPEILGRGFLAVISIDPVEE
jgi:environmental stress-induced protein Ves